jgi:hypothetical protein
VANAYAMGGAAMVAITKSCTRFWPSIGAGCSRTVDRRGRWPIRTSLADKGVNPDDDMVEREYVLVAAGRAHAQATGDDEAFRDALDAARRDRPVTAFRGPGRRGTRRLESRR